MPVFQSQETHLDPKAKDYVSNKNVYITRVSELAKPIHFI